MFRKLMDLCVQFFLHSAGLHVETDISMTFLLPKKITSPSYDLFDGMCATNRTSRSGALDRSVAERQRRE